MRRNTTLVASTRAKLVKRWVDDCKQFGSEVDEKLQEADVVSAGLYCTFHGDDCNTQRLSRSLQRRGRKLTNDKNVDLDPRIGRLDVVERPYRRPDVRRREVSDAIRKSFRRQSLQLRRDTVVGGLDPFVPDYC